MRSEGTQWEPHPPPPDNRGQCHHIHNQHCARMDREVDDIQLWSGPSEIWGLSQSARNLRPYLAH